MPKQPTCPSHEVLPYIDHFNAGNTLPSQRGSNENADVPHRVPGETQRRAQTAFLFDGSGSQPVDLPSMNFSEVITLPGGELDIAMIFTAIARAEDLPPGAPTLKIGENVNDFYILVSPDPTNPTLPLGMKMVAASDGEFKQGETIWLNLMAHRISVGLGESKMSVDPQSQTVSKAPLPDSGYFEAAFSYQRHAKGDLQKITEQQWWHDAKSRHMGIILNSGGMLPKVYFYRDFR